MSYVHHHSCRWAQEGKEHEDFENQMAHVRQRHTEVEANLISLLERLNQQPDFFQVHESRSMTSSECGDSSELSSEVGTQSLGRTEDGLSVLSSVINSSCATPQDSPRTARVSKLSMSLGTALSSRGSQVAMVASLPRSKAASTGHVIETQHDNGDPRKHESRSCCTWALHDCWEPIVQPSTSSTSSPRNHQRDFARLCEVEDFKPEQTQSQIEGHSRPRGVDSLDPRFHRCLPVENLGCRSAHAHRARSDWC